MLKNLAFCATKNGYLTSFYKFNPLVQQLVNTYADLPDDVPRHITNFNKTSQDDRIKKISKAMKAYLDRAQKHDEFMKEQTTEYEIGKRHLANMMGKDTDTFTQDDVNLAIEYLMPSGLFDKKARPIMNHPKEVFPRRKAAEFDVSGRPFNTFFYTRLGSYYKLLHSIVENYEKLKEFEDRMIRKGISEPPPEMILNLGGSDWITKDELSKLLVEEVQEVNYIYFLASIAKVSTHPYAYRIKEFIMKYRKPLISSMATIVIPPVTVSEDGRPFVDAIGQRKKISVPVTVRNPGTGEVNINGKDISFFYAIQDREQLLFPLQFTGLLNKVDIEATVDITKGGTTGWAGAIRHGVSLALRSFVDPEMVEKMRLAGLLQRDFRSRERKKPGQKGARAKYTWKKR